MLNACNAFVGRRHGDQTARQTMAADFRARCRSRSRPSALRLLQCARQRLGTAFPLAAQDSFFTANEDRVPQRLQLWTFEDLIRITRGRIKVVQNVMETPIRMYENDTYVVRVTSSPNASGRFTWEFCRGDDLSVLQQSTKTFPTRIEALFDSAQNAAALALGAGQDARFLELA